MIASSTSHPSPPLAPEADGDLPLLLLLLLEFNGLLFKA
jgi:hypothetical protein